MNAASRNGYAGKMAPEGLLFHPSEASFCLHFSYMKGFSPERTEARRYTEAGEAEILSKVLQLCSFKARKNPKIGFLRK
jgi:hypothetical protein